MDLNLNLHILVSFANELITLCDFVGSVVSKRRVEIKSKILLECTFNDSVKAKLCYKATCDVCIFVS